MKRLRRWLARFQDCFPVSIVLRARLPPVPSRPFCCLSELYRDLVFGLWLRTRTPLPACRMSCTWVCRRCSRASVLKKGNYVNNVERRTDPQYTSACNFSCNFIQRYLPLQKLHAISVLFLNRRKGVKPPSEGPFARCFPLRAAFMGLSTGSPWPASEEEPSIVVGGTGTSSKTESSRGLTKSSALEISGRP